MICGSTKSLCVSGDSVVASGHEFVKGHIGVASCLAYACHFCRRVVAATHMLPENLERRDRTYARSTA